MIDPLLAAVVIGVVLANEDDIAADLEALIEAETEEREAAPDPHSSVWRLEIRRVE